MNYKGYSNLVKFGENQGGLINLTFALDGKTKKTSSMFIGLTPELEIALYTLAVIYKPNDIFKINLGGQEILIKTHVKLDGMKKYFQAAYPLLPTSN